MICEKCGHENNKYSVICEKCGTPLKIENNTFLQEKYHNKGKHIDIEDIEEVQTGNNFEETKKKVSRTVIILIILVIASFLYVIGVLLLDRGSKEVWQKYADYLKNSTVSVFYFGMDEDLDTLLQQYSEDYEFDYLNIKANTLTRIRKKKIREELNIYNMTSTVVVVQSGVPIATHSNVKEKEMLTSLLQEEGLIPEQIEDTSEELAAFREALSSKEPALLYFPTNYREDISKSEEILQSIASEYSFQFYMTKGYLLSKRQLLRMMSQLGYSEIQEDFIVYIHDGKVDKIIANPEKEKKSYFELLTTYGIIDVSSADYLTTINLSKFHSFLEDQTQKYVVLVGSNECTYCDRVRPILGQIASQNNITIYYLNASENASMAAEIQELGVEAGLSNLPILMVIEKSKLLDFVVGLSTRELYIEKLTELGVIK